MMCRDTFIPFQQMAQKSTSEMVNVMTRIQTIKDQWDAQIREEQEILLTKTQNAGLISH
jgi:hypothetical protein